VRIAASLPSDSPYLSVVVTTRNDDHGGDPLKRLQALVNTFDAQWRRAGLTAELIVVEWNPPADRPRLAGLLRRPPDCCIAVRFIEVPPELHNQLRHADVLPLFQMIGKNVGIRRARGQFVLATNIDIIFSNELVEFIASRSLKPGVLYRVDRHDIQSDFPVEGTPVEQMAYCQEHQLRVHTRWGSHPVDHQGHPVAATDDIVDGRSVRLGRGWHVREGNIGAGAYRWAGECVELITDAGAASLSGPVVLEVDIQSSPFDPASCVVVVGVEDGTTLARVRVAGSNRLAISLDSRNEHRVELKVLDVGSSTRELPPFERRSALHYRVLGARLRPGVGPGLLVFDYPVSGWSNANENSGVRLEATHEGLSVETDGVKWSYAVRYGPLTAPADGEFRFTMSCSVTAGGATAGVLSGDASRWLPATRFVNRHERTASFDVDLTVKLDRGERCWIVLSNDHPDGDGVSRFTVHELKGSADPAVILHATISARLTPVGSWWRNWAKRVADTVAAGFVSMTGPRLLQRIVRSTPAFNAIEKSLHDRERQLRELAPVAYLRGFDAFLRDKRPSNLHQNACGDFQLMAREHWLALRGYPEFAMYSMNIDGLFASIACGAGISEEVLEMPVCIYHLEHEKGSGWTPEGEALLRQRIAASGITWLENENVHILGTYMEWLRRPMIFNGPDWGFGDLELAESSFPAAVDEART
jgi:hypothetical protein